jgi:hypothetical protein
MRNWAKRARANAGADNSTSNARRDESITDPNWRRPAPAMKAKSFAMSGEARRQPFGVDVKRTSRNAL